MSENNARSRAAGTVLVTGFGPFRGHSRNSSEEVARRVDRRTICGYRIVGRVLETSWQRAWPVLHSAALAVQPSALIILGASLDPHIRCELIAFNEVIPEADIDGHFCPAPTCALVTGAPQYYKATLPFRALMAQQFADEESNASEVSIETVAVRGSMDAGRFICNQVFYLARHHLGEFIPRIGLVHLPPIGDYRHHENPELVIASGVQFVEKMVTLLPSAITANVQS